MDFKNLSYKQRNIYLLVGSLVFMILVYLTALSKTIHLYEDNKLLSEKIQKAEEAPGQKSKLKVLQIELDKKLSYYLADSLKDQERLLEVVSNFCQKRKIVLKEFPGETESEEDKFLLETSIIVAQGNFKDLLYLVYELEQNHKLGRLSSVSFKSFTDTKTKQLLLHVTIYLQNIKPKGSTYESNSKV